MRSVAAEEVGSNSSRDLSRTWEFPSLWHHAKGASMALYLVISGNDNLLDSFFRSLARALVCPARGSSTTLKSSSIKAWNMDMQWVIPRHVQITLKSLSLPKSEIMGSLAPVCQPAAAPSRGPPPEPNLLVTHEVDELPEKRLPRDCAVSTSTATYTSGSETKVSAGQTNVSK